MENVRRVKGFGYSVQRRGSPTFVNRPKLLRKAVPILLRTPYKQIVILLAQIVARRCGGGREEQPQQVVRHGKTAADWPKLKLRKRHRRVGNGNGDGDPKQQRRGTTTLPAAIDQQWRRFALRGSQQHVSAVHRCPVARVARRYGRHGRLSGTSLGRTATRRLRRSSSPSTASRQTF